MKREIELKVKSISDKRQLNIQILLTWQNIQSRASKRVIEKVFN